MEEVVCIRFSSVQMVVLHLAPSGPLENVSGQPLFPVLSVKPRHSAARASALSGDVVALPALSISLGPIVDYDRFTNNLTECDFDLWSRDEGSCSQSRPGSPEGDPSEKRLPCTLAVVCIAFADKHLWHPKCITFPCGRHVVPNGSIEVHGRLNSPDAKTACGCILLPQAGAPNPG